MAREIYYNFSASAPPAEPTKDSTLYVDPLVYPVGGGYYCSRAYEGDDYSAVTRKSFGKEWTPSNISTSLWLDASDLTTITKDESNFVSQWNDKSGNDKNSTATLTNRPTHNNQKIVFNGSSNRMSIDAGLQLTSTMTVIELYNRSTANILSQCVGGNVDSSPPYSMQHWTDNVRYSGLGSSSYLTHGIDNRTGDFISILIRKTAQTDCFVHGTQYGDSLNNLTLTSASLTYIGARGRSYHNGNICEIIVINSEIDTETRQKIEGYLAWKWDSINNNNVLVGLLPSDHPYKSTQPTE